MHGSRNFYQGGPGPSASDIKKLTFFVFLVLKLFYRSPMVTFKENYHFPRFQRGFNIFQGGPTFSRGGGGGVGVGWGVGCVCGGGGINCLFATEIFQGGGPDPCPPSGLAHE